MIVVKFSIDMYSNVEPNRAARLLLLSRMCLVLWQCTLQNAPPHIPGFWLARGYPTTAATGSRQGCHIVLPLSTYVLLTSD